MVEKASKRPVNQVFCKICGSCPLQLPGRLLYDCARISSLKYYQCCSGYLFTCLKRQSRHWDKMSSLFKLFNKSTRTIDCHLAISFFVNLEHRSYLFFFFFYDKKCFFSMFIPMVKRMQDNTFIKLPKNEQLNNRSIA